MNIPKLNVVIDGGFVRIFFDIEEKHLQTFCYLINKNCGKFIYAIDFLEEQLNFNKKQLGKIKDEGKITFNKIKIKQVFVKDSIEIIVKFNYASLYFCNILYRNNKFYLEFNRLGNRLIFKTIDELDEFLFEKFSFKLDEKEKDNFISKIVFDCFNKSLNNESLNNES